MNLIPPIDLLAARGDPDSVEPRVFLPELLVAQWYEAQALPTPDAHVAGGIDAALGLTERHEQIDESEDLGLDPLFRQGAEICIQNQLGSTSPSNAHKHWVWACGEAH